MSKKTLASVLLAVALVLVLVPISRTNASDYYEISREVEYLDNNGQLVGGMSHTCDGATTTWGDSTPNVVQIYRAVCEAPIYDRAPTSLEYFVTHGGCTSWAQFLGDTQVAGGWCCPGQMLSTCP